jgi:WD40 repeat protein
MFLITPHGTALLTIYGPVPRNLSPLGGPKDGMVLEGIAQEVDIATGEVLFEWHSLDHVALEESYYEPPKKPEGTFDYFHINSIDVDHDGSLLVSGRRTGAVYKIDSKTGEVVWRLGGKMSDFEMDPRLRSRPYQHDARCQADGTITLFNNGVFNVDKQSRGIVLDLNEEAMTATLVRKYGHPDERVSATQGNVQVLPNGNVFVGWGSDPVLSEFTRDGELLFSAALPP